MKIRFLKLKDWLLMSVMGLFGLTACHSTKEAAAQQPADDGDDAVVAPNPRNEMALMYGVPTMDFVVKGRVINEQGNPVKGMQVILVNQTVDIAPDHMDEDNPFVQSYIQKASDTTDAQGVFEGLSVRQPQLRVPDVGRTGDSPLRDAVLTGLGAWILGHQPGANQHQENHGEYTAVAKQGTWQNTLRTRLPVRKNPPHRGGTRRRENRDAVALFGYGRSWMLHRQRLLCQPIQRLHACPLRPERDEHRN